MLPFNGLTRTETVNVAGFTIEKYGCLTVAEMSAAADLGASLKQQLETLTNAQKDLLMKQHIATLLIQSRLNKEWTFENTCSNEWDVIIEGKKAKIISTMAMLDALFEFFINEQKQWKTEDDTSETVGKDTV